MGEKLVGRVTYLKSRILLISRLGFRLRLGLELGLLPGTIYENGGTSVIEKLVR